MPVNTLRMWDSGLRPAPAHMLLRVLYGHRVSRRTTRAEAPDDVAGCPHRVWGAGASSVSI